MPSVGSSEETYTARWYMSRMNGSKVSALIKLLYDLQGDVPYFKIFF